MIGGLRRRAAADARWLLAFGASVIVAFLSSLSVAAQTVDPCTLLPGRPEKTEAFQPRPGHTGCTGQYWIRMTAGPDGRNTVETVGIRLSITITPNAETARGYVRPAPGHQTVPYGDGGREKKEDASAPDSDSRVSSFGELTGERPTPDYQVVFSCGALFIMGSAEPSKGQEARRLVAELNDRLRSESRCGTTAAPAAPAATATPPTTSVPPSIGASRFSVSGDCVREGQGLLCTAQAANPPAGVPLAQVRYMWYLDGAVQGSRSATLRLPTLSPGAHVVGVKAFTPNTVSTDTFTIQVR